MRDTVFCYGIPFRRQKIHNNKVGKSLQRLIKIKKRVNLYIEKERYGPLDINSSMFINTLVQKNFILTTYIEELGTKLNL